MNLKPYTQKLTKLTHKIWDKIAHTIHFTRGERKQRLYFIISPQNANQTTSFSVSYFLIAAILLIFIASILGSFYFYRSHTNQRTLIASSQAQKQAYQETLTTLVDQTATLNQFQTVYHQQINDIFDFLGNYNPNQLWKTESSSHDSSPASTDHLQALFAENNYEVAVDILNQLKHHKISLEHGYTHLTNIENYLVLKKVLSKTIPNGWPLERNNGYKTSSFGPRFSPFEDKMEFHPGVDLAAAPGSKILSAANGIVEFSGEKPGYGQVVTIRHQYGYKTLYAHNESILVTEGETIKKGQPIAILGNTGRSTGHHLHFEVRIGNKPIDPWSYIVKNF